MPACSIKITIPFYIPKDTWEFQFIYIGYWLWLFHCSHPSGCDLWSHYSFIWRLIKLNILKYEYQPFVYLLFFKEMLKFLCVFNSFCYKVIYIFWIKSLTRYMTWQYCLSIFKFFSLSRGCLLESKHFKFWWIPILLFIFLSLLLFMSYPRHHRLTQGHEEIFMLSSESFII